MPISKDGIVEHCTLVLFAKKFEDLPISQRVGDIIRVHRVNVGIYKKVKQFTANVFFNSSWALLSPQPKETTTNKAKSERGANKVEPSKEFLPFSFFGKTFSFDKFETKIIKNLRNWIT